MPHTYTGPYSTNVQGTKVKMESNTTDCIGAIDQGTQSTRVFFFDKDCNVLGSHQTELPQIYPQAG